MLPAYCAPRPPSPILPAQRALHSSHPALPATPHTDRKFPNRPSSLAVRMFCTVLFCAKERSRRLHQVRIQTAYVSRHASRRNVTTHCICTLHVLIQEQRNRRGKELTELLWREWNDTEKSKAKYKDTTATETKITAKLTARDASQTCCLGRAINTRDVTLWLSCGFGPDSAVGAIAPRPLQKICQGTRLLMLWLSTLGA